MSYIHCFYSFLSKLREDAHKMQKWWIFGWGKSHENIYSWTQTSLSDPIEYLPELLTDEIIWKRIGLTGAWIELLKPWNYWPNIETTENMTTFNKSQVLFKFWLKSRWTIIKIQNYLKCLKLYINKTFFFITHIFTFQFIKIYLGIWKISDINTFFIWQS